MNSAQAPLRVKRSVAGVLLPSLVLLWGCGGGEKNFPTAPVKGTVTAEGENVTGGRVTFTPLPEERGGPAGKSSTAEVQSDGTFELRTSDGPGAVIAKHMISYAAPPPETSETPEEGHAENPPSSPYRGLVPETKEVEVTEGSNTIDIKLVPR